jgi:hypothetical protein|tara:strand:+ start:995 stop:1228 length:234 start_codon:yes stop_codon:yes gene_type:complete
MSETTIENDKVLLETVANAKVMALELIKKEGDQYQVAAALISVARDLYVESLGPESARKLFESVVEHFFTNETRVLH